MPPSLLALANSSANSYATSVSMSARTKTFTKPEPCHRCGQNEFLVSNGRCRPCNNRYGNQHRATLVQREQMRGKPCAICTEAMQRPCYDEVEGVFRGWLCELCNVGLGRFRESPALLERAAGYVRKAERARAAAARSTPRASAAARRAKMRT